MVLVVKNPPANAGDVRDTRVQSLGWEDPLDLPGKSHGQRSLAGYSLWGCKESDTAEQLSRAESLIEFRTTFLMFPWIASVPFGALMGSGRGSSYWPGGLLCDMYSSSVTDPALRDLTGHCMRLADRHCMRLADSAVG